MVRRLRDWPQDRYDETGRDSVALAYSRANRSDHMETRQFAIHIIAKKDKQERSVKTGTKRQKFVCKKRARKEYSGV